MIGKLAQRLRVGVTLTISIDVNGRHGLPEGAPAGGEHARPNGAARGQERQHLQEEHVREGADVVLAASQSLFRVSVVFGPLSRSVEQVARAG